MKRSRIAELEGLLSEALAKVIVQRGQSEQISLADYRRMLTKCRSAYEPNARIGIFLFRPEMVQSEVKERVFEFVGCELRDYIRDGRIYSATIAFAGGLGGGSPIEDVVRNLIRRTIIDGPTMAAQAFVECTLISSCKFYRFFLITGISIPEAIEVFDGITLIPVPDSADELPPHLPIIIPEPDRPHAISPSDLLGRTLVRVEYRVSPIFHRPAESYTLESGPEQHFKIRLKSEEIQDPNLDTLFQALAVVGRCNVQSIMTWTSLVDYEIFDLSTSWGIGGSGYNSMPPVGGLSQPVQIPQLESESIKLLYRGLTQVPTETWEKMRIPIDRWAKSMAEGQPIDKIIDLGIALESLYVPDAHGEVRFRLALHAAYHLGKNKTERQKLMEEFKDIYDARSDVVHTGRLRGKRARPTFDVSKFVSRVQDLCWQGITSVINSGEIPEWEELILGE